MKENKTLLPHSRQGGSDPSVRVTQQASTSSLSDNHEPSQIDAPEKIVYENESLKLYVTKGFFKRQRNFKLTDQLYHLKIVLKEKSKKFPKLVDILDFLHAGLIHILDEIKHFYANDDHNIAYLTLHQFPLISGLCTGLIFIFSFSLVQMLRLKLGS